MPPPRSAQSKPKVLLFTGAPLASSLTIESCTINTISDAHQAFIYPDFIPSNDSDDHKTPSSHATWRSLPQTKSLPLAGFSQTHQHLDTSRWSQQRSHFFNTLSLTNQEGNTTSYIQDAPPDEALLAQFCEHSLAQHHTAAGPSQDQSFSVASTSFATDPSNSFNSNKNPSSTEKSILSLPSHLSDLEDIPSPKKILALYPQTITLNLIVGIISIAQPRAVTTRWGQTLSLVEILVGDDTKAGFAITFWLPNPIGKTTDKGNTGNHYTRIINELRRQDVVLLQNVALHIFRDKVYGQSLRGGWTKVDLLWRRDGGGYYSTRALNASTHPQQQKTKIVKQWVMDFVGGDPRTRKGKRQGKARKSWDEPPDDTQ